MPDKMNTSEVLSNSLETLEKKIANGLKRFLEVGAALVEIRERKLYQSAGYTDFDQYCKSRWRFTRQHAHRLIQAKTIHDALSPIGDNFPNESQLREFAPLADKPEVLQDVAFELIKQHGQKLTATKIREKVRVVTGEEEPLPGEPLEIYPETIANEIRKGKRNEYIQKKEAMADHNKKLLEIQEAVKSLKKKDQISLYNFLLELILLG